MRIRQLTAAATAGAAALLLTACGGGPLDGKTGPEVATAAADALEAAGAVHVAGTVDQDGEESVLDLHLQGEDATGSITVGGVELQLLNVGGTLYLQAPLDFWASSGMPEDFAAMFDGQWVIVPAEAGSEFEEFSLASLVDDLRNPDTPVKDDVRSDEVDGKDVVVIEQEDGSTLSVVDDERAYPLEVTNKGDSPGTMTFSRFGEKEDITEPADALDLTEMMGA